MNVTHSWFPFSRTFARYASWVARLRQQDDRAENIASLRLSAGRPSLASASTGQLTRVSGLARQAVKGESRALLRGWSEQLFDTVPRPGTNERTDRFAGVSGVDRGRSRHDLLQVVAQMRTDRAENGTRDWENRTLDRFLGALEAVLDGFPGRLDGEGKAGPAQPSWAFIAKILVAATGYEVHSAKLGTESGTPSMRVPTCAATEAKTVQMRSSRAGSSRSRRPCSPRPAVRPFLAVRAGLD